MVAPLVFPSFIAGIITFLAPCTLPLVPGYLGFISGTSLDDLRDPARSGLVRKTIFLNAILYVLGFSSVFVLLGSLVGLGGQVFVQYRIVLAQVGGVFIALFGLYMIGAERFRQLRFLQREYRVPFAAHLKPGTPLSSLVFGATFAFGWTPCVGPILGSILILAASSTTVGEGTVLLSVFALGLAIPFLLVALAIGWASQHLVHLDHYLRWVSLVGGLFLVVLGVLVATNNFGVFIGWFFHIFEFLELQNRLLDYL